MNRRCDVCHAPTEAEKQIGTYKLPAHFYARYYPPDEFQKNRYLAHTMSEDGGRFNRHLIFNLSCPELSKAARAPLAKEAGGLGVCQAKSGETVFQSRTDPDYLTIVAAIARGREHILDENNRFCMINPSPNNGRNCPVKMADVDEIVFAVRESVRRHYYENFGHSVIPRSQFPLPPSGPAEPGTPLFGRGGRLCRLNLRTGELAVLLDDPEGGVRDPQVHYSGRKILFSYRRDSQQHYHLSEIGVDGSGLVQLTDGPFDDIEPTYLPDGGIMFCSSRCRRVVGCFPTPVATLYRSDAAGRNIRPISANPFTDNTPWMLADGRVLYTRWEYVDRNQMTFHHLWTANTDGTAQMVFLGNQYPGPGLPPPRFFGVAMLDAKPIPGSVKVVASFSPNHGQWEHMGFVTVVDPNLGPDARQRARTINTKRQYRDPWAFSEDCFLVADERGIWVMDGNGNTELVYQLPVADAGLACHEPRPIVPRPCEPILPNYVELNRKSGELLLADVYMGRSMAGVRRGEIKKLLVLEQLPKPVDFSGGPEPLTIGGTFTLERILGTVPVEPDGSAYFEAPAGRPLFFVALDERDLSVKRMQSFVTVQPGEQTGCVGCHEPRRVAPLARPGLLAAARPPSQIQPDPDVPDLFDYPRDVQPILDRHCVACHNPDRREGGVDLCGDHTPIVTVSYWTMLTSGLISDGRNYVGDQPPRSLGSSASRLLKLGEGGHYDAKFTPREYKMLRLWIESGAPYPGREANKLSRTATAHRVSGYGEGKSLFSGEVDA